MLNKTSHTVPVIPLQFLSYNCNAVNGIKSSFKIYLSHKHSLENKTKYQNNLGKTQFGQSLICELLIFQAEHNSICAVLPPTAMSLKL